MICPSCGHRDVRIEDAAEHMHSAARVLGSKGGKAKGARKARSREHYVAAAKKRWGNGKG